MKDWSFGKLLGVFGGCFVGIIILSVVVLSLMSGPQQKKVVSSSKTFDQPQQRSGMDVVSLELQRSQEQAKAALAAQEDSEKKIAIVHAEMQRNNKVMFDQISSLSSSVHELSAQIAFMQRGRATVEIIKPARKEKQISQNEKMIASGKVLPADSGYKVQATVGNRAWVRAGDVEDSVKPGERLPANSGDFKVHAIDNASGVIIAAPAR